MSAPVRWSAERAGELAREFDLSFAQAPRAARAAQQDVLAIRVAGAPYALRLAELSAVIAQGSWTALPGSPAELLGIAGLRGALLPVYSLAPVLGVAQAELPRWIALAAGAPLLGLAFDALEGLLRVSPAALAPRGESLADAGCVRDVLQGADGVRPIVHVPSVRAAIARRLPRGPER